MGRIIDWIGKNKTAAKIGASTIGGAIGMIGEGVRYRRNLKGQEHLMDIQQQNQMALNQQGHQLQMDMWKKTNYPAQIAMMKEAGLNPALMYGQAGASGQTGSQGGGSAAGGNVPAVNMNDMLMGAQIANINADTDKKRHEGRLAGLKADEQNIVLSFAESNEQYKNAKLFEELNEATEKANIAREDRITKEILNNMKKQGILDDGASIEWFTRRLGIDVSEPNFMDKKVEFLPDGAKKKLEEWGIEWNPGLTRRQIMVALEGAIAGGQATISGIKWGIEVLPFFGTE